MEIIITKIHSAGELMAALDGLHKNEVEVKVRLSNPKGLANEVIKNITDIKTDGKTNSTALIITTQSQGPMWPGKTPKMITSTKKIPCSQIINIKIK